MSRSLMDWKGPFDVSERDKDGCQCNDSAFFYRNMNDRSPMSHGLC